MRFLLLLPILLLLSAAAAPSEHGSVAAVRAAIGTVRSTRPSNTVQDAGPELNAVKDALRIWVESQLPEPFTIAADGISYGPPDYAAFTRRLNAALDAAELTCGDPREGIHRCGQLPAAGDSERGYVGEVEVTSADSGRYVILTTGVGIRCGVDESAYVYEHRQGGGWRLIFAAEERGYTEAGYKPRNYLTVDVPRSGKSVGNAAPPPLVAALSRPPACASNWHTLTARLWRASPATTAPAPLLDRTEGLYMGDYFVAAERLTKDRLLVEWRGESLDEGVLVRSHVLHYAIGRGDRLTRIAPVALNPAAFTEEWMSSDWAEAKGWTMEAAQPRLRTLHARLAGFRLGEMDPLRTCRGDATLWQVGFTPSGEGAAAEVPRYFKVRWLPPYRFTLLDVALRRFPGCDREEVNPDNVATLFPEGSAD